VGNLGNTSTNIVISTGLIITSITKYRRYGGLLASAVGVNKEYDTSVYKVPRLSLQKWGGDYAAPYRLAENELTNVSILILVLASCCVRSGDGGFSFRLRNVTIVG
jgi:hypothetical protein